LHKAKLRGFASAEKGLVYYDASGFVLHLQKARAEQSSASVTAPCQPPLVIYPMHTKIAIQELAIVFAVRDQNPQSFNLDFLKYSGVVPADWQLAKPLSGNQQFTRLIFQNDVHIVAQVNTITIVQPIMLSDPGRLHVPELARRYVRSLPNIDYLAVGISPKSLIKVSPSSQPSSQPSTYVLEKLLHSGDWQHQDNKPAQATINLIYPLDRCTFQLTVEDVTHQVPDQPEAPAVLVSGNFHYPVSESIAAGDRAAQLHTLIDHWKIDLKTYLEIVNQRFLSGKGDRAATAKKEATEHQRAVKTPAGKSVNKAQPLESAPAPKAAPKAQKKTASTQPPNAS
jgi:hypothetical protein